MEKEQQVKKKKKTNKKQHRCKVCKKWFPSGRSLGGHMRSHGENPKKTWRCSDDSSEKQCRECGKCFPSCQALFGHMRCHSDKGLDLDLVLDVDLDLAFTLMMLSRDTGRNWDDLDLERSKDEIFVPAIDGNGNGNGKKSIYECSTCKKSFESYQALGGHRASHKRLRMEAIAIDGTVMPGLLDLNMPAVVVTGDSNLKSSSSSSSSSWWKCEPMLGLI